jgi:hypothetical protein
MNLCSACREDFSSVSMFDQHRVGKHAYTYSQGVAMDPIREDGRRCLSAAEMVSRGWQKDSRARWSDPRSIEAVRVAFSRSQSDAKTKEAAGKPSERIGAAA